MTKSAAILTIHNPSDMTDKGRDDVVKWLRKQASFLKKHNKVLSKRFTARYLYDDLNQCENCMGSDPEDFPIVREKLSCGHNPNTCTEYSPMVEEGELDPLMKSILHLSDCLLATHPDTPKVGTVPEMIDEAVNVITRLRQEAEAKEMSAPTGGK